MGLVDVFNAVQTRLTTVLTALGAPVPEYLVGAQELANQTTPPRIIWVPTTETIQGPHAQGGDGVRNPRPLRTRHAQVQAHIWGADIPACEALAGHLVAAIHDVCHGVHDEISADWTVGQTAVARLGWLYVLAWEVQIPFTRELDVSATVTAIPITPQVLQPA
jgi:hypothetical protein